MCAVFIAFQIIHPQFGQQTFVGKTCFERPITKHGWCCRITIFELPPGKDHEPVPLPFEATLCQSTFDGLGFLGRMEAKSTWHFLPSVENTKASSLVMESSNSVDLSSSPSQ